MGLERLLKTFHFTTIIKKGTVSTMLKFNENQKNLLVEGTILSIVSLEKRYSLKDSLELLGLTSHKEALKSLASIKQEVKNLSLPSVDKRVVMRKNIINGGYKNTPEMLQLFDKGFLSNVRQSYIMFYFVKVGKVTDTDIVFDVWMQAQTETGCDFESKVATFKLDKKFDKIKDNDVVYLLHNKEVEVQVPRVLAKLQELKKGVNFKGFLEDQELKLNDLKKQSLKTIQYWIDNNIEMV